MRADRAFHAFRDNDARRIPVSRHDPDRNAHPAMQRYKLDVNPGDRMLLDVVPE
ncbi:hypothetical protein [Burkholderia anthina]|uniref:hypothetical protein n=1 Tax=Burkholderia anthina TaxID=179879 RepID=UPI0037BED56A